MNQTNAVQKSPLVGPILTFGLATAVAMWCIWFITHLPGLSLPTSAGGLLLIALIAVGPATAGRLIPGRRGLIVGTATGLLAGVVNLLLVGAHIAELSQTTKDAPSPLLVVGGFLLLSLTLGVAGALIGRATARGTNQPNSTSRSESDTPADWSHRLMWVVVAALTPLVLIGGLVTSTKSGMAVPDWPGSYGSNMFLLPLGMMADPRIFLEHSHRLFGSLVGLASMLAFLYTTTTGPKPRWQALVIAPSIAIAAVVLAHLERTGQIALKPTLVLLISLAFAVFAWGISRPIARRPHALAAALFALICVQGMLGGIRVTGNSAVYGIFHGLGGQVTLAIAVACAVMLGIAASRHRITTDPRAKSLRIFATAALHSTLVQIALGATYRHLSTADGGPAPGAAHAVLTHAGFALVVTVFICLAAFTAIKRANAGDSINKDETTLADTPAKSPTHTDRLVAKLGKALVILVGIQFVLGWIVFAVISLTDRERVVPTADALADTPLVPIYESLTATAHQAIGALLLTLLTALLVYARRIAPRGRSTTSTSDTKPMSQTGQSHPDAARLPAGA